MTTYRTIAVALDTSARSRRAAILATRLGEALGASVSGIQVDIAAAGASRASRLLDALPSAARPAPEPDGAAGADAAVDSPFAVERVVGRAHTAIARAVREGGHDLLVLGATRFDEPEDAGVGAVCERLVRSTGVDTLVVKTVDGPSSEEGDTILLAMDGSRQAYGGLLAAIELARTFGKSVEAVAVYDPYLHYTLFNGIVNVLSEKAASVFKFKDQEKLHEEIIDTGLAKIYQAHLEIARDLAQAEGVDLKITLLDGKASNKLLRHAGQRRPWLLVVGRIGVHSDGTMDVGATAENLLRTVDCDVLVTSREHVPPVDVEARANIEWTPDALQKMERVPSFVKGVATTAILRWAKERGHSIITMGLINQAMGDLLPPGAAQAMGYIAEEAAVQLDGLAEGRTFICQKCGHAVKDLHPKECKVCGADGSAFEAIDREALERVGRLERGHLEEEETFDGHKLTWTSGAKAVLRRIPSGYQRRRSKARIEKSARVRGLTVLSEAFAVDMVEQELADTAYLTPRGETLEVAIARDEKPDDAIFRAHEESALTWTDAAWKRLERVPFGFMRTMTREKIEQFAAGKERDQVDLALCEEGIAEGRRLMAEMMAGYGKKPDAATEPPRLRPQSPPLRYRSQGRLPPSRAQRPRN